MNWKNVKLIFLREVRDQLRDRRTLFMITILPVMLYPLLGLGIVEMLLTFSEQQRVVVILNADQLPASPALLDDNGIREDWFGRGADNAGGLRVVTDLRPPDEHPTTTVTGPAPASADGMQHDVMPARNRDHQSRRGIRTSHQLLESAKALSERILKLHSPHPQSVPGSPTDLRDTPTAAIQRAEAVEINRLFSESGFQVLVYVQPGYADAIQQVQRSLAVRPPAEPRQTGDSPDVPPILIVRNSADDKSLAAAGRVQQALKKWEDAIRQESFEKASLPEVLQHPARISTIELAQDEQVAASIWSKLFPALIVIMALTGAFYPAIDLAAGEKERGTMETLLISPAKRVELVLGKFLTIMLFSVVTALMNLLSMGLTGQQMASVLGGGLSNSISLELPGLIPLMWLTILLLPLSALFSALCLALATFARSSKEGQYYLTPLLMIVMGLTMFCLSPAVEMMPLYSVIPVVNVALLLKGLLLSSAGSSNLLVYAIPVLISSIGYSLLALWWSIELYNSETVLFREAEKLELRVWFRHLLRTKDAVPAFPEAVFCFILILLLQFGAMTYLKPDLAAANASQSMMQLTVIQQLTTIACPAVFMGMLLTTSLQATFRLRMPSPSALAIGAGLAFVAHPLSFEFAQFLVEHQVFPEPPESIRKVLAMLQTRDQPGWLVLMVFAVTPAICEELAFRGFILSGLARGGRLAIAVGISSLMFGIIHLIPQQAFNAALLGLVLGLLAIYSRSLFPAITFHFCNNALAVFHAGASQTLRVDGVFLSRDQDGLIRYEAPLLVLCSVAGILMVSHMIRTVMQHQDRKRRGLIPAFGGERLSPHRVPPQRGFPNSVTTATDATQR